MSSKIRRIFSGIQPTGVPHVGNYLGAVRNWVRLQDTAEPNELVMFCVVDLHSCTTHHDPKQLNENVVEMVASLLACGIDPKKSLVFQQSRVFYVIYIFSTGKVAKKAVWRSVFLMI